MWADYHWRIRNGLWFAQDGQRPLQIASHILPNLEKLIIDVTGRIPVQLVSSSSLTRRTNNIYHLFRFLTRYHHSSPSAAWSF